MLLSTFISLFLVPVVYIVIKGGYAKLRGVDRKQEVVSALRDAVVISDGSAEDQPTVKPPHQ
jgi:hypothetical protein